MMRQVKIPTIFSLSPVILSSFILACVCNGNIHSNFVQMGEVTDNRKSVSEIGNSASKVIRPVPLSRKSSEDEFLTASSIKLLNAVSSKVDSSSTEPELTKSNPIEELCKKVKRKTFKELCEKIIESQTLPPSSSPSKKASKTKAAAPILSPTISPSKSSHEKDNHSSTSNSTHSSSKNTTESSTHSPTISPTAIDIIYPSLKPTLSPHLPTSDAPTSKPLTNTTITPASNSSSNSTDENDKQRKPSTNATASPAANSTNDKDKIRKKSNEKPIETLISWMIVLAIFMLITIFCVTERVRVYFFLSGIYFKSGIPEIYPKIKGAFAQLRQKYGPRFGDDVSSATPPMNEITFLDESDHFTMNEKLLKRYI